MKMVIREYISHLLNVSVGAGVFAGLYHKLTSKRFAGKTPRQTSKGSLRRHLADKILITCVGIAALSNCFRLRSCATSRPLKLHHIFDNNQRSIDKAPLPFMVITIRIERSITKYSMPSPFFFPDQFIVHPSAA